MNAAEFLREVVEKTLDKVPSTEDKNYFFEWVRVAGYSTLGVEADQACDALIGYRQNVVGGLLAGFTSDDDRRTFLLLIAEAISE